MVVVDEDEVDEVVPPPPPPDDLVNLLRSNGVRAVLLAVLFGLIGDENFDDEAAARAAVAAVAKLKLRHNLSKLLAMLVKSIE